MADLATHLNFTADLDRGVQLTELKPALLSGDVMAHRFVVDCLRDGRPVPLAGATVQGYLVRADETTVLIPGTTSGSAAVVTLPADCYAVPGRFALVIRVTQGGVVNTVLWTQGSIGRATTATVTDPAAVLPTPEQVLAIIQRADAAAVAAEAAAPGIIANASGEVIGVQDAASRTPRSLRIGGRTTQAATPTPDAPQPLMSAGEDGDVLVLVAGKNLLRPFRNSGVLNGITFTPGEDGSITLNGTASEGFSVTQTTDAPIPAGAYTLSANKSGSGTFSLYCKTSSGETVGSTSTERTFETTEPIVSLVMLINADSVFNGLVIRPQLEAGSAATAYATYQGQPLTLATPGGLAGIPVPDDGNTADASGQAWLSDYVELADATRHTLLGSFTLDGSEGYAWSLVPGDGFNVAYAGPQDKWADHDPALADDTRLLSTHFAGGLLDAVGQIKLDANFLNLSVPASIATSADFNAWLADNPVTVLYMLAAPVVTSVDAPAVTLPAPDASVLTDSGCPLALDYLADTRLYIDQRIAALTAAVLSTGANI